MEKILGILTSKTAKDFVKRANMAFYSKRKINFTKHSDIMKRILKKSKL